MTVTPALTKRPVVSLLEARSMVLAGGESSIGVREQRVDAMRRVLDTAVAELECCRVEMVAIERVLAPLGSGTPAGRGDSA